MVASLTDLANQALRHLGAERITNIAATDSNAVTLNEAWPITRDGVLRDFDWACATKRAQLAELSVTNISEYDYVYQRPTDCLRMIVLIGESGSKYTKLPKQKYEAEGAYIYTDLSPAYLAYVWRQTDVTQFDSTLLEALALKLAADTAMVITSNEGLHQRLLAEYTAWLMKAEGTDAQESREAARMTSPWGFDSPIGDVSPGLSESFVPRIPS